MEVFEAAKGTWLADNVREIKSRLVGEAAASSDRLARFVGRARYEAEGGTITEDLFGENIYFNNAELLTRLAEEQLAAAAEVMQASGWKWIETSFQQPDWQVTEKLGRIYSEPVKPQKGEAERRDELAGLIDDHKASEKQQQEHATLSEKLDARFWTERQKVFAGAFLYIGHDGTISTDAGYVRPDDRKAAEDADVIRATTRNTPAAKPSGPYSNALTVDLGQVLSWLFYS